MNPRSPQDTKWRNLAIAAVITCIGCQVALLIILYTHGQDRNAAMVAELDRRLASADALVKRAESAFAEVEFRRTELESKVRELANRKAELDVREDDLRRREAKLGDPRR